MNELKVFEREEFGQIRTIQEKDGLLFCGKDIAVALGYTSTRKAINDHCKNIVKRIANTPGGKQELSFIPESDVCRLVFGSKLPNKENFIEWIMDGIIPSLHVEEVELDDFVDRESKILNVITALKKNKMKNFWHLMMSYITLSAVRLSKKMFFTWDEKN